MTDQPAMWLVGSVFAFVIALFVWGIIYERLARGAYEAEQARRAELTRRYLERQAQLAADIAGRKYNGMKPWIARERDEALREMQALWDLRV